MLFGGLIIYHLRIIERLFGPAKYVVSRSLRDYASEKHHDDVCVLDAEDNPDATSGSTDV